MVLLFHSRLSAVGLKCNQFRTSSARAVGVVQTLKAKGAGFVWCCSLSVAVLHYSLLTTEHFYPLTGAAITIYTIQSNGRC